MRRISQSARHCFHQLDVNKDGEITFDQAKLQLKSLEDAQRRQAGRDARRRRHRRRRHAPAQRVRHDHEAGPRLRPADAQGRSALRGGLRKTAARTRRRAQISSRSGSARRRRDTDLPGEPARARGRSRSSSGWPGSRRESESAASTASPSISTSATILTYVCPEPLSSRTRALPMVDMPVPPPRARAGGHLFVLGTLSIPRREHAGQPLPRARRDFIRT